MTTYQVRRAAAAAIHATFAATRHCESCGEPNPATDEGYTECCNELVCDGRDYSRFGTADINVQACCWAAANVIFEAKGIAVPEGFSRLYWDGREAHGAAGGRFRLAGPGLGRPPGRTTSS